MITTKKLHIKQKYRLFWLALPFVALVFLFSYLPLYGWIYAFFDYKPGFSLSQCKFMGFYFFRMMLFDEISRGDVIRVLTNTFAMSGLGFISQLFPMLFAVLMVEITNKYIRKIVQTLTTMPNFLSWPLVYAFAFALFSIDEGFINRLLLITGLVDTPINFLASPNNVWLVQTAYYLWKTLGWSAIIYLASISSIDSELYEAARIDGAGSFNLMLHITLPHLIPTLFVMLILNIASFLNTGMEQYFVFQNAMNKNQIEVLDLYVYNVGLKNGLMGYNYSFATAVGMLKSIVSIVLLFSANLLSKKIRGESIL